MKRIDYVPELDDVARHSTQWVPLEAYECQREIAAFRVRSALFVGVESGAQIVGFTALADSRWLFLVSACGILMILWVREQERTLKAIIAQYGGRTGGTA